MSVMDVLPYVGAVFLNGVCVLSAADVLLRLRGRGRFRFADRWDVLNRTVNTLLFLVLSLLLTTWAVFPVAVWYLDVALSAGAAAAAVLCWPGLPARAADAGAASRRHSAIGALVFLAVVLAVFLLFS
ncbi:hypothetical protein AB0M72_25645 [Nocardiopsis dassonvillei]|uniref:hypothetical protein n=1 Tax=Nocardiopsis dassonvillei TaxID=2014 RepID=UPI0020103C31|nr:hypothetical protein [Nocardiopsis dassonvillei]MCK9873963.1 hypothetical protein [Nocardiopsis dassonvillei]